MHLETAAILHLFLKYIVGGGYEWGIKMKKATKLCSCLFLDGTVDIFLTPLQELTP